MAPAADESDTRVPGLFLRIGGAVFSIALYLLVRDGLDPTALVAARFGLGVVLFALFIDLGRAITGAAPPLTGSFTPHEQRAEPLVDEHYRQVHRSVRRFIDDGTFTDQYHDILDTAMAGRGVPAPDREEALAKARATGAEAPPSYRPLALGLASGFVVVLGIAIALGVLLEASGVPLAAPMLVIIGLGTVVLQVRTVAIGERWGTLAIGLGGALLVFLGATGLQESFGGRWSLVQFVALALAVGAVVLTYLHRFERPSWPAVRQQLQEELSTLRRAFVATLLAGIVLFPFQPLLEALFVALDWRFDVPYRMAVIGYATIAAFLAIELAGAWYALGRGEQRASRLRQARIAANEDVLGLLEAKGPAPGIGGRVEP